MYAGKKVLHGSPQKDPQWIIETAKYAETAKVLKLTDEDKKLIRELFFEYQREGLSSKVSLEKAKNVVMSFKK